MDRELLGEIALMVAILMPMWVSILVLMPSPLEEDLQEYRLSEESKEFRRSNRLSNLTTWVCLILAILTVVIVFLQT